MIWKIKIIKSIHNYKYTIFSGRKQIISIKYDIDFDPDGYLFFDAQAWQTVCESDSTRLLTMEWFGEGCFWTDG